MKRQSRGWKIYKWCTCFTTARRKSCNLRHNWHVPDSWRSFYEGTIREWVLASLVCVRNVELNTIEKYCSWTWTSWERRNLKSLEILPWSKQFVVRTHYSLSKIPRKTAPLLPLPSKIARKISQLEFEIIPIKGKWYKEAYRIARQISEPMGSSKYPKRYWKR